MGEGFGRPLPYAQHLLCDLHMKENIVSKMNELGIRGKQSEVILISIESGVDFSKILRKQRHREGSREDNNTKRHRRASGMYIL